MYISRSTGSRLEEEFHRIMSVSYNSSLLLSVALLFMSQLLLSTHAAAIRCKKNCTVSVRFKNCAELYKCGQTISGVYAIDPDDKGAFNVYCDQTTDGGGWTVIQKRVKEGTVDFNRTRKDYENGFGDFSIPEFWLGLNKIRRLTKNGPENKLRVHLGVTANKTIHREYKWFGIENKTAGYRLNISNSSSGNAHDSLSIHNNMSFGTWDEPSTKRRCASMFWGGWWYKADKGCCKSNLNGIYPHLAKDKHKIHWAKLNGNQNPENTSPSTTEMKIRRKDFSSWVNGREGFCFCHDKTDQ